MLHSIKKYDTSDTESFYNYFIYCTTNNYIYYIRIKNNNTVQYKAKHVTKYLKNSLFSASFTILKMTQKHSLK